MNTEDHATASIFSDFARLLANLPNYEEREELIILKGHLLMEELLHTYIERRLPNGVAFDHNRFTFSRCVMIADALTAPAAISWVFKAATKLNALRNDIAHNITRKNILHTWRISWRQSKRARQIFLNLSQSEMGHGCTSLSVNSFIVQAILCIEPLRLTDGSQVMGSGLAKQHFPSTYSCIALQNPTPLCA